MDFKNNKAIYLQIADFIFDQVLLELWRGDEKIPSVRDLAVAVEVNPNTVMRAYEMLQGLEIIYNKRGIGYFVSPQASDKVKTLRKEQFMKEELPVFFRNLYLLDIDLDDLRTPYQDFLQSQLKNQSNEDK